MPKVICELHGGNIAPLGCRHVADSIWARQRPGHITHLDLDGFFFQGWICDACVSALENSKEFQAYLKRNPDLQGDPTDEEMAPFLDLVDLQPMCAKCFEELSKPGSQPTEPVDP